MTKDAEESIESTDAVTRNKTTTSSEQQDYYNTHERAIIHRTTRLDGYIAASRQIPVRSLKRSKAKLFYYYYYSYDTRLTASFPAERG